MCWGLIFGVLLVVLGISTIVNVIFHIHIPVFGVVFGIFLLYLGIQFITGFPRHSCWHCWSDESKGMCMGTAHIKFSDETFNAEGMQLQHKTIFGRSKVDLSSLTPETLRTRATPVIGSVDTVFGKTDLILNKNIPTRIIAKSVFAKAAFPDQTMITFGSHTYNSNPNEQPLIIIHSSTVFGDLEVEEK